MTKQDAVAIALADYTGQNLSHFANLEIFPGTLRNVSVLGYSEGEEWAVVPDDNDMLEGYVVFIRAKKFDGGGWVVLEDEIEEVEFASYPPNSTNIRYDN